MLNYVPNNVIIKNCNGTVYSCLEHSFLWLWLRPTLSTFVLTFAWAGVLCLFIRDKNRSEMQRQNCTCV